MMRYGYIDSPVGRLLLAGDTSGLRLISFRHGSKQRQPDPEWIEDPAPLRHAMDQLDAYFAGVLHQFTLKLAPQGTAFQQAVWCALQEIPYGATCSYGELARRLGKPRASRAVGAANGRNPLPIVIPCHRVIGHNGKLTGYGGGLAVKEALLAFEHDHTPATENRLPYPAPQDSEKLRTLPSVDNEADGWG